jgi:hypothetical protein
VVRIKKERWYSLDVRDDGQPEQKMDIEGEGEGEGEKALRTLRTLTAQRDELLQQNEAFRQ